MEINEKIPVYWGRQCGARRKVEESAKLRKVMGIVFLLLALLATSMHLLEFTTFYWVFVAAGMGVFMATTAMSVAVFANKHSLACTPWIRLMWQGGKLTVDLGGSGHWSAGQEDLWREEHEDADAILYLSKGRATLSIMGKLRTLPINRDCVVFGERNYPVERPYLLTLLQKASRQAEVQPARA